MFLACQFSNSPEVNVPDIFSLNYNWTPYCQKTEKYIDASATEINTAFREYPLKYLKNVLVMVEDSLKAAMPP